MLYLDKGHPLPQLKRIRRKADHVLDVVLCVALGYALGRVMDSGALGVSSGNPYGVNFYEYAVPVLVFFWASFGAYGQYKREVKSASEYREVGVSGYLLGWNFFMSHVPDPEDASEDVEQQCCLAEEYIQRALTDKKGYLVLKGRDRYAVREWLDMTFLPHVTEKEREWIPRWVCWRVLRDNHCG